MSIFYAPSDDRAAVMLLGGVSADGGGAVINIGTGEITPVPPWEWDRRFAEVMAAAEVLEAAIRFKDSQLQQQLSAPLASFIRDELVVQLG